MFVFSLLCKVYLLIKYSRETPVICLVWVFKFFFFTLLAFQEGILPLMRWTVVAQIHKMEKCHSRHPGYFFQLAVSPPHLWNSIWLVKDHPLLSLFQPINCNFLPSFTKEKYSLSFWKLAQINTCFVDICISTCIFLKRKAQAMLVIRVIFKS